MKKINKAYLSIVGMILFGALSTQAQVREVLFSELKEKLDDQSVKRYYYQNEVYSGKATINDEEHGFDFEYTLNDGYIQHLLGWYKSTGTKERDFSFKDGISHGKLIGYYDNGQKYFEETYVDGLLHGKQYGWYGDGNKRLETEFINGLELMRVEYPKP